MEDPSEDARDTRPRGLPVAFDPEAATAQPGLPGFLARPEGEPVYHGFVVLDDVEVDGFRFGIISDFQEPPSPWGDAFVIAPDNSRAGLVWELFAEPFVREIQPFEDHRWGVWSVGFPVPMRTPEDAQRNLAAVLPLLKEQWQRDGERVGFISHHRSIFGTALSPPEPGRVVEALRRAGFPAARAAELTGSPGASISFALHYAPLRAPVFVDLEWLNPEERDVNTSTWELAEEHLSDPSTLQRLRCYADVRHDVGSDRTAIQAVVDFLQAECGGLGVFPWQMV